MAHPEIGRRILERLIADLGDLAIAETMPRQEGNQMHVILSQRAGRKNAPARPKPPEAATGTAPAAAAEAAPEEAAPEK
jgi:translation initiation factor IF-3